MNLLRPLRDWLFHSHSSQPASSVKRKAERFLPRLETLEDRAVPATIQGFSLEDLATDRNFFVDSRGLRENKFGSEKWLRGDAHQFGNSWYYILPNGDFFEWKGDGLRGKFLLNAGPLAWEDPEQIVDASNLSPTNPAELQAADQIRGFYRASKGNFRFNDMGGQEKWIKGRIAAKSVANRNNPWYFIRPNGSVFEWNGQPGLGGTQVAAITPDVSMWEDPTLLADAFQDESVNSAGFDEARHLLIDRSGELVRNYRENFLGADEKWLRGDVHQFGNNRYFLLPNSDLHEWNGQGLDGSVALVNLGANAWHNLERVADDFQPALTPDETQQLLDLDMQYSLFRASNETGIGFNFNRLGLQEKWLTGKKNSFGNHHYLILPDNTLIAWNGREPEGILPIGKVLATNLPAAVYADPLVLADAFADGGVLD